jgi:hypothetical protein
MAFTDTEIELAIIGMAYILGRAGGDRVRYKKDVVWALDWIIEVASRRDAVQSKLWSVVARAAETDRRLKARLRRGLVIEIFGVGV